MLPYVLEVNDPVILNTTSDIKTHTEKHDWALHISNKGKGKAKGKVVPVLN
jgi:hypothetical protein